MNFNISDIFDSFLQGFLFMSILFSIHLVFSFHPYHRITPLLLFTSVLGIIAITINYYFFNTEISVLELLRESLTNSIISILFVLPLIFLISTIMMLRLSLRNRFEDPLLNLLDSVLNSE